MQPTSHGGALQICLITGCFQLDRWRQRVDVSGSTRTRNTERRKCWEGLLCVLLVSTPEESNGSVRLFYIASNSSSLLVADHDCEEPTAGLPKQNNIQVAKLPTMYSAEPMRRRRGRRSVLISVAVVMVMAMTTTTPTIVVAFGDLGRTDHATSTPSPSVSSRAPSVSSGSVASEGGNVLGTARPHDGDGGGGGGRGDRPPPNNQTTQGSRQPSNMPDGSGWRHQGSGSGLETMHPKKPMDRDFNESMREGSWDVDEILPATCGFYARRKSGCVKPRSCFDCLEMDDCMINQFGACVNMTRQQSYEPSMDYHRAFEFDLSGPNATNTTKAQTTQRYHFPAVDATYCPASDEICQQCKQTEFVGDVTDSRFCVGANDCLCIASCEATGWEQLAGGVRCGPPPKPKVLSAATTTPAPGSSSSDDPRGSGSSVHWQDVWTMGGIPALVVVVGVLVIRSHRKETRQREEGAVQRDLESDEDNGGSSAEMAATGDAPRPGRLNLAGWQSLRRHLIKKEHLLLDGSEAVSPKHHFVDLLNAQPDATNPQVTMLAAPVMGLVTVEASAPPMSPQGLAPTAPSFDSDFDFSQDEQDLV